MLVVEDDDNVRNVILQQLSVLGYETLHAECGSAAMALLEKGGRADVLLTDIMMPGKYRGPELAVLARTVQPQIGVVLMSGYADQISDVKSVNAAQRLAKPFSIRELGGAVQSALAAANQ